MISYKKSKDISLFFRVFYSIIINDLIKFSDVKKKKEAFKVKNLEFKR